MSGQPPPGGQYPPPGQYPAPEQYPAPGGYYPPPGNYPPLDSQGGTTHHHLGINHPLEDYQQDFLL